MILSIITAIYILILIGAFHYGGIGYGIIALGIGIVVISLIPQVKKMRKEKVRLKIASNPEDPLINVNKAPWYILEELPEIDRVMAKRIVYIRNHYGKYTSVEDFFEKLNINTNQRSKIEKIIYV